MPDSKLEHSEKDNCFFFLDLGLHDEQWHKNDVQPVQRHCCLNIVSSRTKLHRQ